MAVFDYAERFLPILAQKYATGMKSHALTQSNQGVTFLNAQTIKLPRLTVSGYKDHARTPGFNSGTLANDWEPKKLEHDRDIEFFVDPMDVDETNLVLSIANIQNVFEDEQAIPEIDSYRFSKLYAELAEYKPANISTNALTAAGFLAEFDDAMAAMDEEGVPEEGRILYVTPTVAKLVKEAEGIQRSIEVSVAGSINRKVHSLDDVEIVKVPSGRMKTEYDFTDGCVPADGAKQINFILVHPSAVVARDKYSYIKVFTPGTDSRTADGYLYQNRRYGDLFLLEKKAGGCFINAEAGGETVSDGEGGEGTEP